MATNKVPNSAWDFLKTPSVYPEVNGYLTVFRAGEGKANEEDGRWYKLTP